MAKTIKLQLEVEDSVYNLLKEFLGRVQNAKNLNELFLIFIKQGVSNSVQQIVAEKITVVQPKTIAVPQSATDFPTPEEKR